MTDNIWLQHPQDYTKIENATLKNVVHPIIIDTVQQNGTKYLLDYGCGDGRLLEKIKHEIEISVFDKSDEMLKLAEKRIGKRIGKTYNNPAIIPKNYFDCVILSMILVCIDNNKEFKQVLSDTYNTLKTGGIAIIAVTHPCFRQYPFSDYDTSYCHNQKFDYFKEGEPFEVTIVDKNTKKNVTFLDYHWTLSYTVNKLIETGFTIKQLVETKDDITSKKFNSLYSPFLVLIAQKNEK